MTQLHSAEDAIKQAVEAGYDWRETASIVTISKYRLKELPPFYAFPFILQDPAMWQTLGKAREWAEEPNVVCSKCGGRGEATCSCTDPWPPTELEWKWHALRYFETLLSGGDMNAFWQSLP
jgi:acetone carboxylase gamma subunit